MGWFVSPDYQGKGLATEASNQIINKLAGLKIYKHVYAFHQWKIIHQIRYVEN